ncbi:hypothetical protein N658DRAFT_6512 [Parathielavia hyrcaniae]|uniref:Uncharacterized protein n=1 Tax=Parathielavia hyrcaniae TaxID=113614 RepID=A0AAN6T5M9_9PEZI|nr:hypothetical protein N658DRAFT_6512 [Parathielavia hyrcaniae]
METSRRLGRPPARCGVRRVRTLTLRRTWTRRGPAAGRRLGRMVCFHRLHSALGAGCWRPPGIGCGDHLRTSTAEDCPDASPVNSWELEGGEVLRLGFLFSSLCLLCLPAYRLLSSQILQPLSFAMRSGDNGATN